MDTKVAQRGVSSKAISTQLIVNIWPIFCQKNQIKTKFKIYKRDIMQLFSEDATTFLKFFYHFLPTKT